MTLRTFDLARVSIIGLGVLALVGCSTAPKTADGKRLIENKADVALARAKATDPSLDAFLRPVAGYAVFPSVGKGAAGVGGAYGKGVVYDRTRVVGYCDLSQVSLGFALGGQAYTQIIAFETDLALRTFKQGNLRFAAQATAVALKSGVGANAGFAEGVAVFTLDEAGLMYEAAIGGQKFAYQPR
jgi:lipid-binding SYLF domain-containing protein